MLVVFLFSLPFYIFAAGCKRENVRADKLVVAVSILPQKYFVERIAKDKVKVVVLLPPGRSPEIFEPSVKQFQEIASAKIYFKVGHPKFPFEANWAKKIEQANKNMKVVSLADALELSDNNLDPHIWLAPSLVKKELDVLTKALTEQMPAQKEFFDKNKKLFIEDIDETIEQIKKIFAKTKLRKFMTFHPAFGYFAKEFGLEQIAIEKRGKNIDPRHLEQLIGKAKREGIKVIFVQKQFSRKEAREIAKEIDGEVSEIDPLAEDWLANLKKIAEAFANAMK